MKFRKNKVLSHDALMFFQVLPVIAIDSKCEVSFFNV